MKFVISTAILSAMMAAGGAVAVVAADSATDNVANRKKKEGGGMMRRLQRALTKVQVFVHEKTTSHHHDNNVPQRSHHEHHATQKAASHHHEAVPQKTDPQYFGFSCGYGEVYFYASWSPDDYPGDNYWVLKEYDNDSWSGLPYEIATFDFSTPDSMWNICLDSCKSYAVEIFDSHGDGLSQTYGGSYPYFYADVTTSDGMNYNIVDISESYGNLNFGEYYWGGYDGSACQYTSVNCGAHEAQSCFECPVCGNDWCGSSWCNGECSWDIYNDECVPNADDGSWVNCGGHEAPSCLECPIYSCDVDWCGEAWCNGECYWDSYSNSCVLEPQVIDGRPLIDASGIRRQADAVEVDGQQILQKWSEKKMVVDGGLLPTTTTIQNMELENLSQEWTKRALGEHASIGSFAVFTMALLTNQAPPDLIQASLTAAEDELRHAKVSFEVASLLRSTKGESPLEPGPYPSTSHDFSNDMIALAVAAAEEGCVDETLSALVAAAEADFYATQPDLGELGGILQDSLDTIAMEEGRHSILAWRTVHWACLKDVAACEAAKATLDSSEFASSRFSGRGVDKNELEKVWESIRKSLVSLVTTGVNNGSLGDKIDCTQSYESNWKINNSVSKKSKMKTLADNIFHGLYCSILPGTDKLAPNSVTS